MLIAGIDEAGRGPCLGPMVLAVTLIDKENEEALIQIGVKDSKLLSKEERERQFPLIQGAVIENHCIHISPQEIDELMDKISLNEIEAMLAGKLLNSLTQKPDVVYVDSPDIVMAEFANRIKKYISFPVKIISEHKADVNYPIVSAASIIAKVERDNAIKKIASSFGEIGSGYSHDDVTINFLKKYLLEHNMLPEFARKSWATTKVLHNERFQTRLY
ncbi:MAG: ribonuclease HII [archaeon]|nr:ribonuclease HII [archaeon]